MEIAHKIESARAFSRAARAREARVALVPTMGALHEGHLSLVRAARAKADTVVVSIFVNPTQFGPNEDFAKYPRNLERDCELLQHEGVNLVFAPSADEIYPPGDTTWVEVQGLSERLCGRSRPGHFRGVTTVVSKLFHIIEPDVAFFGQKDAAQVAIIRRMARDLHIPVDIAVGPIVRESDGLAMSSRNSYLSPEERKSALVLHRSLTRVQVQFDKGERDTGKLISTAKEEFAAEPAARVDYSEIVDPNTLEAVERIKDRSLVAVAAFLGRTRLIDNILLEP